MVKKLNPFAKPLTVDGVLASFRKTVEDLHSIAVSRSVEIQKIETEIDNLRADRNAAEREAVQANSIADKLEKLIS